MEEAGIPDLNVRTRILRLFRTGYNEFPARPNWIAARLARSTLFDETHTVGALKDKQVVHLRSRFVSLVPRAGTQILRVRPLPEGAGDVQRANDDRFKAISHEMTEAQGRLVRVHGYSENRTIALTNTAVSAKN